jgi:fructose-bisphosphate aldolase, class I
VNPMQTNTLEATARSLVAPGKGILAADESTSTIQKRFDKINVESTEDNRRAYRDLLFTADGIGEYISGVILFDETIRQSSLGGIPFPKVLESQGVIPGIKVDSGAKPLALADAGETITEGLDGLRDRLGEYHALGARFAKWRATYTISDTLPSQYAIDVNADALARYAALCQEIGLVPIVEPEVMMEGDHTIQRSHDVTSAAQEALYHSLYQQRVHLPGTLLKPNMVLSGYDASEQAPVDEVADRTLACFYDRVPAAVPGIVFLSGGQSDEDATAHLNAMNQRGPHPWELSFSYGRALQAAALQAWQGDPAHRDAAQAAFLHRAKLNSLARSGTYAPDMERQAA